MKTYLINFRSRLFITLVEQTKYTYIQWTNKKRNSWAITMADLVTYPKGTLGKDLANFLIQEKFDLIAGLESHDVYHVLLEYGTAVEAEAEMQFFLLGNGKRSLYAIGTSLVAFLMMPDQWLAFWKAYDRGRHSTKVHLWNFQFLLKEETAQLHALINKKEVRSIIPLFY